MVRVNLSQDDVWKALQFMQTIMSYIVRDLYVKLKFMVNLISSLSEH